MGNISADMLRCSYFVFFDDMGIQAVFTHKKDISFKERYHIYSLYFIFISSAFDIYNVQGSAGPFNIFDGNDEHFV